MTKLDEILPDALASRMEREADANANRGDGLVDPAKFYAFLAGVHALHKALLESVPEFDEAAAEQFVKLNTLSDRVHVNFCVGVARWQFEQLAPVVEALRAENEAWRVKNETLAWPKVEAEIARLRAEVERLNHLTRFWRKQKERLFQIVRRQRTERDALKREVESLKHASKIASDTTKQFVAQYDALKAALERAKVVMDENMDGADWREAVAEIEKLERGESV